MSQFTKRVNKILSVPSLNQKDYVQVKSISKEQFYNQKKQSIEKAKQRKRQNDKYFMMRGYQNTIKKFNNNLFLMRKIVMQNKKICQAFKQHKKIMNKISKIALLQNILSNMEDMTIFLDDIDKNVIQQIINKG